MRWLLQSPLGKNPGDDFIRLGVMKIVKIVDPGCEFIFIDKMEPDQYKTPVAFDKAIWCGGPVFWSKEGNQCHKIRWWDNFLMNWVSERKKDFLILGAGSFTEWPDYEKGLFELDRLAEAAEKLEERTYKIVARDSIVGKLVGAEYDVLVCPAIFAGYDAPIYAKKLRLTNLMPDGGHYRVFGLRESMLWDDVKERLGKELRWHGFTFIAHEDKERDFAKSLGWRDKDIICYDGGNAEYLAELYANCGIYVGNRVHGAIAARLNSTQVYHIGYDSRCDAVSTSGAVSMLPSEVQNLSITSLLNFEYKGKRFNKESMLQLYVDLVKDFANA